MHIIADGGMTSCNVSDTIDAIMLTKNINYVDGIKLDVRKTKDNYLVLSKYDDLSKLTLSNKKISDCNYDYVRKIKFPSHIFKYYIPTLDEVLNKYNKDKIVILELFNNDNIDEYLNNLYEILTKYNYKYYFISNDKKVLDELELKNFQRIGEIILDDSNIKLINDLPKDDEIVLDDNVFILTEHPEKIYKSSIFRQ